MEPYPSSMEPYPSSMEPYDWLSIDFDEIKKLAESPEYDEGVIFREYEPEVSPRPIEEIMAEFLKKHPPSRDVPRVSYNYEATICEITREDAIKDLLADGSVPIEKKVTVMMNDLKGKSEVYRVMSDDSSLAKQLKEKLFNIAKDFKINEQMSADFDLTKEMMDKLENMFREKLMDNKGPLTIEDIVKAFVPENFPLGDNLPFLCNSITKQSSLIINEPKEIDKMPMVYKGKHGRVYMDKQKCGGCRRLSKPSLRFYLNHFPKTTEPPEWMPKIPCPTCKRPSPVHITWRYMCPICIEEGCNQTFHRILCKTCMTDDDFLRHVYDRQTRYDYPEDYVEIGTPQRPNSNNPLFTGRSATQRPSNDENTPPPGETPERSNSESASLRGTSRSKRQSRRGQRGGRRGRRRK